MEAHQSRTPPVPFGFESGWIAVRSIEPEAVAESLPIRFQCAANWCRGIEIASRTGAVFIAPPVSGWVCIVGDWTPGTADRRSVKAIVSAISDLSARFGEAHAYATHRVIEHHHWILSKAGRLVRCFAYIGAHGILCESGSVTDTEKTLPYARLLSTQWVPSEQDVMTVASGWSFDPSRLSSKSAPAAIGILADLE